MVDQIASVPDTGSTDPRDPNEPLRHANEPLRERGQAPNPRAWARHQPLLMRLHFDGGMSAGPFILIAAVTGLLYTFTPQSDAIVFRHEDAYSPQVRRLTDQIAAAGAVVFLAVIGWFAPMSGAIRGLFVLGDVVAGEIGRRKGTAA